MDNSAYVIGFYLSRASWAMKHYVDRLFKEAGMGEVSMGFIGVLLALYQADGQTLSELSERVSLEKSTMTGLIDRMAKSGLVRREPDGNDRRSLRVWLTDDGREAQTGVAKVLAKSFTELTDGIALKDIEKLQKLLTHMIENAKK